MQVEGSPEQVKPGSIWHEGLHPSPGAVFESWSHYSIPLSNPSPQIGRQEEGYPVQVQPVSCWQELLHPSFGVTLESSHVSPESNAEFGQVRMHWFAPFKLYPAIHEVHCPLDSVRLKSVHASHWVERHLKTVTSKGQSKLFPPWETQQFDE